MIVDGSNLLFQMFYGMPARIVGKHGKLIHGTLGFVGALLKILKMTNPTHAVVLFDGECKNARCEVDADYKANRPDYSELAEEETPFSQLPDVFAALKCLQIPYAETTECETDDWIAAYAKKYGADTRLVVSSFDSDFFQLVTDTVGVLRYRGDHSLLCDPAFVRSKYGVEPSQYADFKCLVGDSADNVAGVRGVGPKTAAKLLNTFGTLAHMFDRLDSVQPQRLQDALRESAERLETNRRLIVLTGEAEIPFPKEALLYRNAGKATRQVLTEIGVQ